eukprot:3978293-Pleurochrysis_carterae.AAC.1
MPESVRVPVCVPQFSLCMSLSSLPPKQAAEANDKLEASDAEAEKLKVGIGAGDEEERKAKAEAE